MLQKPLLLILFLSFFYTNLPAQGTVQLSGCKFYDLNCNGVWDAGEPTIGNWPIIVLDASGSVVVSTTTDSSGCWSADVPLNSTGTGFFVVSEGLFAGWTQSFPTSGVYSLQVAMNQPIGGLDFGNCFDGFSVTFEGCKFNDLNCNGIWDPNEPTIPDWPIVIKDQVSGLTYNLTTDASGCYHLSVPATWPGSGIIPYEISEVQQSGWTQTYPSSGFYFLQEDGGVFGNLDFGNCQGDPPATATLFICKFNDLNCNGQWDPNESGLPDWPIYITDLNTGNVIDTVYTSPSGCLLTEVPAPGSYEISEGKLSPYWHQTYPASGSYQTTVMPGDYKEGLIFGNNESHLIITACKFHDLDCDSLYNPDVDTLLPNWPIVLTTVISSGNVVTTSFDTVYTNEFGCYIFDLPPGAFYSLSEPGVPGWAPTLPLDFDWDFTDPLCGSIDVHLYFGNKKLQPYLLTVCKIHDVDCDGQFNPDVDTSLAGWPIVVQSTCYTAGNVGFSTLDTLYTDPSGCVVVEAYPGCEYVITEADVPGWIPSADNVVEFGPVDSLLCSPGFGDSYLFLNCQEQPQDSCGAIVEDSLEFYCDEDGFGYTYTFFIQNYSPDDITSFLLTDFPPSVNVDPVYFSNSNYPGMFPIPPGGTAGPFVADIGLPAPQLEGGTGCFKVIFITNGETCCHFEHCVEVPPVDPCEGVFAEVTPIDPLPNDNPDLPPNDCCYEINLFNDFCPNFFTGVRLDIQTPGVVFSSYTMGSSLWSVTPNGPTTLFADYLGGINGNGYLPLGDSGPFYFCINVDQYGGGPVQILLSWLVLDPATGEVLDICEEIIEVECTPPCALVTGLEEVLCLADGSFRVPNFCVSNNTTENVSSVLLEVQTPGVSVSPDNIPFAGNPTCTSLDISGAASGDVVVIKVILLDEETGWCCHIFVELTMPDCIQCIDPEQIDSTITCTTDYNPVCGCDGVTYPNECFAIYYGGVTEWMPGPCPGSTCIDQSVINTGYPCLSVYEPVCGCDGVTYTNACIAYYYYGITQWTPGECPTVIIPPDSLTQYQEGPVSFLTVYPNPANDLLFLPLPKGEYRIEVLDLRGRLVDSAGLSANEDADADPVFKVNHLLDGVYLLQATDTETGKRYLMKFVKSGL